MSQNALNNQTYDADFIANRQAASAGTSCALAAVHNDAVNSGSTAEVVARSQSASGADAYHVSALASTRAWCHGIDASDSGALKETTDPSGSTSPSSGTLTRKVTTAGEQTMPLQPSFNAYLSASDLAVTGAGATYLLGSGNLLTITGQQGTGLATNGVFTAPVQGFYHFDATLFPQGVTALMTLYDMFFFVNGFNTIYGSRGSLFAITEPGGTAILNTSLSLFLPASGTVQVGIIVQNGAGNTITMGGGVVGSSVFSTFDGYLVC